MRHKRLAIAGGIAGTLLVIGIAAGAAGSGGTPQAHTAVASAPAVSSAEASAEAAASACGDAGGYWNAGGNNGNGACDMPGTAAPAPAAPSTPAMTLSEQQAVASAQGYLDDGQGFSYQGLLKQLTSSYGEGFSQADAKFAIRYLHPDWYQQAVESAKNYLADGQGFSHDELYQQLTSGYGEGFTPGQANYALRQVGL